MQTAPTTRRTTARATRWLTLVGGLVLGLVLGGVVPLGLPSVLGWEAAGGWGTVVLTACALALAGVAVERATSPASWLGRGLAVGVVVGCVGVVAFALALVAAVGS